MIEFELRGAKFKWDGQNQQLYTDGQTHKVHCEMDAGLLQINTLRIDDHPCPIPAAFQAVKKSGSERLRKRLKTAHFDALLPQAQSDMQSLVHKLHWSCDDIARMSMHMDQIARSSGSAYYRETFGQLLGAYMLLGTQSILLFQLLKDAFEFSIVSEKSAHGKKTGGSSSSIDELTHLLAAMSLEIPEVEDPRRGDVAHPIRGWLTTLRCLSANIHSESSASVIARAIYEHGRRNRGRYETLMFVVLIGMVLDNYRSMYQFREKTTAVFLDTRLGHEGEHLPLAGLGLSDHLYFESGQMESIQAGVYIETLNMFPPIPLLGHLFKTFPEDIWWKDDGTGSMIHQLFQKHVGNPSQDLATRLDYLSIHAGMSMLFVYTLCNVLTPFNMPFVARWTGSAVGWAFVLLLFYRVILRARYVLD